MRRLEAGRLIPFLPYCYPVTTFSPTSGGRMKFFP